MSKRVTGNFGKITENPELNRKFFMFANIQYKKIEIGIKKALCFVNKAIPKIKEVAIAQYIDVSDFKYA